MEAFFADLLLQKSVVCRCITEMNKRKLIDDII